MTICGASGRQTSIVEVKERRGGRGQSGRVICALLAKGSVLTIDTTAPFSARSGHATTDWQERGETKAERWVREKLLRQGWREADLGRRRQSDPARVRIAGRLRGKRL